VINIFACGRAHSMRLFGKRDVLGNQRNRGRSRTPS
jgi:hypothetical protein